MTQSQIAQTPAFTVKELLFLHTMTQSDFYEDGINSVVWDYSVNDDLPYDGKTRSGVISSLAQKNIINVYKKERGDIAGTYSLTNHAKSLSIVRFIFN